MSEVWICSSDEELEEHLDRHLKACRDHLHVMHNAVCHPQTTQTMTKVFKFLAVAHCALYDFCVKTFYLYRQFKSSHVQKLSSRLGIQLFTGEILDLLDEICRQSYFVDSRVNSRKSRYIRLRWLCRVSKYLEKYLVYIRYWKNMGFLDGMC